VRGRHRRGLGRGDGSIEQRTEKGTGLEIHGRIFAFFSSPQSGITV
jgi:hypothetical protein